MKLRKRIERTGKRLLRNALSGILKTNQIGVDSLDKGSISKILLVRQDSRLGNLVLMTPLVSALRASFPSSRLDVMISEGFEDVLSVNPCISRVHVFRKRAARYLPWVYPRFVRNIRQERYDLAIDVSDGHHVSFNNTMLTALSGARYRMGYDREEANDLLNIVVPRPPENVHMADAMIGLARFLDAGTLDYPMKYYATEDDRVSMSAWLRDRNIGEMDSFFIVHAGGRGKKQWGGEMFAALIDLIGSEVGVKIVLIGGPSEHDIIRDIREKAVIPFEVLSGVTVGEMAAVIERCDMFISNDTGPMHVSSALEKPTVGIFLTSNYRVYGPRGPNGRIVAASSGKPSIEDVMMAVMDLIEGRIA